MQVFFLRKAKKLRCSGDMRLPLRALVLRMARPLALPRPRRQPISLVLPVLSSLLGYYLNRLAFSVLDMIVFVAGERFSASNFVALWSRLGAVILLDETIVSSSSCLYLILRRFFNIKRGVFIIRNPA